MHVEVCRVCEGSNFSGSVHGPAETCIEGRLPCDYPQEHHPFTPMTEEEYRQRCREYEEEPWMVWSADTDRSG